MKMNVTLRSGQHSREGRLWQQLAMVVCSFGVLLGSIGLHGQSLAGERNGTAQSNAGSLASVPSEAQGPISASIGRDNSAYHARFALKGYRFDNAEQGLEANFGPRGLEVRQGRDYWLVRLQEYGRGANLVTLKAAGPTASKNRIEYERGVITEWYVNGPMGIEQGFTIASQPRAKDDLPLSIILALSGNVTATVDDDKRGVTLTRHFGQGSMQYTGLTARDAMGKTLPSWLELQDHQLLIKIDDLSATYPVSVDPFMQSSKLIASAGKTGDRFGYSVANNYADDTVVVGVPAGEAAYIFERPEKGWAKLTTKSCKLTAGGKPGDNFGVSVSVYGDTVVVGANKASGTGEAYVFVRPGKTWPETGVNKADATLAATDTTAKGNDNFGYSVSIKGSRVVVGAPAFGINGKKIRSTGKVYIFKPPDGGWKGAGAKAPANTLEPKNKSGHWLGYSVAQTSSRDKFIVVAGQPLSSYFCDLSGTPPVCGRALVFVAPKDATVNEAADLIPSDGNCKKGCLFGTAVSAVGDTIAVGAPGAGKDTEQSVGAVYVFKEPKGGWDGNSLPDGTFKLVAPDAKGGDKVGTSLDIGPDLGSLLVGAPAGKRASGKAYLFKADPKTGSWKDAKVDKTFTTGNPGDRFGCAVSTSRANEVTLTVGAWRAQGGKDDQQQTAGAAYIFVAVADKNQKVKLDQSTSAGTGISGVTSVSTTGSGFLNGNINPTNVVVTVAPECRGDAAATITATGVVSGDGDSDSKLISFLLPAGLDPGKYYISISDYADGDANFESSNCSVVDVVQ